MAPPASGLPPTPTQQPASPPQIPNPSIVDGAMCGLNSPRSRSIFLKRVTVAACTSVLINFTSLYWLVGLWHFGFEKDKDSSAFHTIALLPLKYMLLTFSKYTFLSLGITAGAVWIFAFQASCELEN